jgi:hypothetical protein
MLDHPDKTPELLAALKAALPFEVELTPPLIAKLRKRAPTEALVLRRAVSDIFYLGDEAGITCSIGIEGASEALLVSITHLKFDRSHPLAAAVIGYQKHRVKKIKKQRWR